MLIRRLDPVTAKFALAHSTCNGGASVEVGAGACEFDGHGADIASLPGVASPEERVRPTAGEVGSGEAVLVVAGEVFWSRYARRLACCAT